MRTELNRAQNELEDGLIQVDQQENGGKEE